MGKSDLPDMYAQARGPQGLGRVHLYQGKTRLHMLYNIMLCNTFITIATILVG